MKSKQKFLALALGVAALSMGSLAKNANACYLNKNNVAEGTDCDQVARGYGSLQQSITVSAPGPLGPLALPNLLTQNIPDGVAAASNIASKFASVMQPVPYSGSAFVDQLAKSAYCTLPGPVAMVYTPEESAVIHVAFTEIAHQFELERGDTLNIPEILTQAIGKWSFTPAQIQKMLQVLHKLTYGSVPSVPLPPLWLP